VSTEVVAEAEDEEDVDECADSEGIHLACGCFLTQDTVYSLSCKKVRL
jgi:hypothetical protein